jgi:hypothetical protein
MIKEQSKDVGIPETESEGGTTSTVGRYVDIPVEHAGYPGAYEKDLEERKEEYGEREEAAVIVNNNQK